MTSLQIETSTEVEKCFEQRTFRITWPMPVLYSKTNCKVMYSQADMCGIECGMNLPMFSGLTLSVMRQRKKYHFYYTVNHYILVRTGSRKNSI